MRYVGPQLDDDPGAPADRWAGSPAQPLVLIGLSSTVMRQEALLQRAADALGQAQMRGLVTTGPAVDPAVISAPRQCHGHRWTRYADVLPHCSAVITHGGHGTVMKALIADVPLILAPLGRYQPDNAARGGTCRGGHPIAQERTLSALRCAVGRVTRDPATAPPHGTWRPGLPANATATAPLTSWSR